jgi:DNA end-binding protein Ku
MAPRSFWKGYLKLSLVTCRVAMTPVKSESEKIRFHTINRKTGNRIQSRYVDAVTGDVVDEEDEVKGYPRSETEDIMLEDEELAAVALESTRTIDIGTFVDEASISPIWYDVPHYLFPDDDAEAFAVIRQAMQASGKVGIARLVLYRRERAVLLKPRDEGIIVWTLRYGDEVRDTRSYFGGIKPVDVDPKLKSLVADLIAERTTKWSDDLVKDPVQDRLVDIIKSKQKTKKAKKPTPEKTSGQPTGDNVISLMDALKRSLKGRKG